MHGRGHALVSMGVGMGLGVGTLLRGWARTNAWAWARSCEHGYGHGLGRGHVVERIAALSACICVVQTCYSKRTFTFFDMKQLIIIFFNNFYSMLCFYFVVECSFVVVGVKYFLLITYNFDIN